MLKNSLALLVALAGLSTAFAQTNSTPQVFQPGLMDNCVQTPEGQPCPTNRPAPATANTDHDAAADYQQTDEETSEEKHSTDPRQLTPSSKQSILQTDRQDTDRETKPKKKDASYLPPLPPEPPTEFQELVQSSVGRSLPVFGYKLFTDVPTTFTPLENIAVPANYVIGPGDELMIRVWGQVGVDARVTVDRNGQIFIPKIGTISVAGVSYQNLPEHMKTAIGRVFRNFELTVTLGKLRSIQVFVVGYARRPGTYTVSSLSTLVNVLFASGGPSTHGSLRHIQVKRDDRVVTDFDLYALLLKGDKSKDIPLLPGDVIYIPAVGRQVAFSGSVNFPAIYELNGTVTLADGLDTAGGLTNVADGQRVMIERIENRTTRKIEEFQLNSADKARELHDGDLIRVFSVSPRFENAVTLRGNVADPGRYPYREGMRVRDLIPSREFLLTRQFWKNQNSFVEKDKDRDKDRDRDKDKVAVLGTTQVRNDVKRNAPEINWDYAIVQRLNPEDLSSVLLPFNLGKAIIDGNEADNLLLKPGDVVTIFTQRDIEIPIAHQSKFVRLAGEFGAPGMYRVNPGETLRSLIARAGGLTSNAFIFGTEFTRESARLQQTESLDRMARELEMQLNQQALYAAKSGQDKEQALQAQSESQRTLLQKLREIKATGRIVLKLDPALKDATAFADIPLEDGDTVTVPHTPSTVAVVGSVYNQNSFVFEDNTSVGDYLNLAGSGNRDADLKHMFVIRANGSVLSGQNTKGMWSGGVRAVRVLPGDTVVVPPQVDKGSTMRAIKDWSQVIAQLGLGAAAINLFRQ